MSNAEFNEEQFAASLAEASPRWQPIESAPRGTDDFGMGPTLLLFVPTGLDQPDMVTIGIYFRENERDPETGCFSAGQWEAVDADMMRTACVRPSHWMPLPPAPESA